MFDVIKSSYYLQEQFTNVELQTKDMEPDIGGTMTHYWICPNGLLWRPDYTGTNVDFDLSYKTVNADFVRISKEGSSQYIQGPASGTRIRARARSQPVSRHPGVDDR